MILALGSKCTSDTTEARQLLNRRLKERQLYKFSGEPPQVFPTNARQGEEEANQ